MTPDEFRTQVLPVVHNAWERDCFCKKPGFRKLLSFNFEDYRPIGPVGLMDSEILGHEIVVGQFVREKSRGGEKQPFRCPRCSARCWATYEDYSISMYRTYYTFDSDVERAAEGIYIVGFYGFRQGDFEQIHDFRRGSEMEFLQSIGAA